MTANTLRELITIPWLDELVLELPGAVTFVKPEWDAYVLAVGTKQFARFGEDGEGIPSITLKGDPHENSALRQAYPEVVPGYYSNKVHWNTIRFVPEATIPAERVRELLEHAYEIVFGSLSKKLQAELRHDSAGTADGQN